MIILRKPCSSKTCTKPTPSPQILCPEYEYGRPSDLWRAFLKEKFLIVCFLLGNSLASEFYTVTFRNTPFHLLHLSAYEDVTECSETSAYKIQTPRNHPEENIQHTEHGESLKSRNYWFGRMFTNILSLNSSTKTSFVTTSVTIMDDDVLHNTKTTVNQKMAEWSRLYQDHPPLFINHNTLYNKMKAIVF
jgi:hypothetical protein